jgi:hypothetical protein
LPDAGHRRSRIEALESGDPALHGITAPVAADFPKSAYERELRRRLQRRRAAGVRRLRHGLRERLRPLLDALSAVLIAGYTALNPIGSSCLA